MSKKGKMQILLFITGVLIFLLIVVSIVFGGRQNKTDTKVIGFIMSGAMDEQGWNGMHYEGIIEAGEKMGVTVLVKENVELATTGTYEYKVVKNRGWDWKGVNEGNNLTLTGVDVDGTYNVTFTLNKELNALTASLELVEAKKVIPECYVAGDESLTGQDWNAKSVLMTYDEATEVYTATLTAVPAGTHNMKVVYGGEWLGFDHLATPAPANVKEGDDKKIQFTLAEAGDVTVTYHATNGIGLTGNFAAPAVPGTPTSVDNVEATVAPVKMIENGQLIIVKDGVQYNAQGAILK